MTAEGDDFDPLWERAFIPLAHWHFHRQLLARYGMVLAPGDFSQIVKAVKKGKAHIVKLRPPRDPIYVVRVKSTGKRIFVVVSAGEIVTAWPPTKQLNRVVRSMPRTRKSHLDAEPSKPSEGDDTQGACNRGD